MTIRRGGDEVVGWRIASYDVPAGHVLVCLGTFHMKVPDAIKKFTEEHGISSVGYLRDLLTGTKLKS